MAFQAIITVIHVLSAVVWLGYVPSDLVLRRAIRNNKGRSGEKKLISIYLELTNIAGIIGMSGLLLTGIILVSVIPYYFFFNFASNHWLATKQIIMVILMVLVFAFLIPRAKKVRSEMEKSQTGSTLSENNALVSDQAHNYLKGLETIITIINVLVLINFLLGITHRYFG